MQPIRILTLSLFAGLLLVVPAMAEHEAKGPDHAHDADCACGEAGGMMGPHGDMGPHGGMGPHGDMMGPHGGGDMMGPHGGGKMMGGPGMDGRKHRRMGQMGLSPADRELINKYPKRQDDADFSWHPNRLRASAIEFLATDVYRLAILPFNDISSLAPVNHDINPVWAERMLRDTLAGSLLETGILVLPAENVEAAVIELKGFGNIRTSTQAYSSMQDDPFGAVFSNTMQGMEMSDTARNTAAGLVLRDRARTMPSQQGSMGLGALGTDYTPEEIRMIADALDVDGLILGSISSWGVSKNDSFLDLFSRSSGELVVNIYVYDGATGEPIWGSRQEVHRSADWWKSSRGKAMMDGLSKEFSGTLLKELSHPVPMWYVDHLRGIYGIDRPHYEYRHRGGQRGDGDGVAVSEDANIQRWKRYTHHVDSSDRESKRDAAEDEVRGDRHGAYGRQH